MGKCSDNVDASNKVAGKKVSNIGEPFLFVHMHCTQHIRGRACVYTEVFSVCAHALHAAYKW